MKILKQTIIKYKNDRVTLSQFEKGSKRFYVSNGCTPLGLANTLDEAYVIYKNKVRALKSRRTREFNKLVAFVRKNKNEVDFDCVKEVVEKEFYADWETVKLNFQ